jgi:hypothetical protein
VTPRIRDPFAVIPMQPENVELRRDSRGRIHLRLTPQLKGFQAALARWLHYDCTKKVELDQHGTLFYGLVDGTRSLAQIVDAMTAQLGKARKEIEPGVILFTKGLMTRRLLLLKVADRVDLPAPNRAS